MRPEHLKGVRRATLLAALSATAVFAQDVRVEIGKRATAIPKICESVVAASIEGEVDTPALIREADCKGAGDMLSDYTYVMSVARRERKDKGRVKEEALTYEVYMPTLKSGTHAGGVLLLTSRNGVAVPSERLEKERMRAGLRLEKEEDAVARTPVPVSNEATGETALGMTPLGMYTRSRINRASSGKSGGAVLDVHTFLQTCELKFIRREQLNGRETLVFNFTPRPDAQFDDSELYIAQLTGTIRIDARERVVTRLVGWPNAASDLKDTKDEKNSKRGKGAKKSKNAKPVFDAPAHGEATPAVFVEMTRLSEGVWLPREIRFNGAAYPALFDRVTSDITFAYSEYKRFNTETKDVRLDTPKAKPK
jgi:hypothetical protein